jgi:hypothetical protein
MSDHLQITRYFKNQRGDLRQITTNCEQTRKKLIAVTDKVDQYGYINRKTQDEAQKDPTPLKP